MIPDSHKDILEGANFACLATLMPSGSPQNTPIWYEWDGEELVFSTVEGRQKDRNVRRDPHVALAIMDRNNPYRYVQLRGRVTKVTKDGAIEWLDRLAMKYRGTERYTGVTEGRELVYVRPDHVKVQG